MKVRDLFDLNAEVFKEFRLLTGVGGLENEITAVTAVYNEYYKGLNCGILDLETELPAFNEKLKGAGIDKMVDSAQAQLDEWYASKDGN